MSRWYLDTSAALKLIVEEAESDTLATEIDSEQPELVACWLLETELRRAVQRESALDQAMVTELLQGIDVYAMPASLFREAGLLPDASLCSLDTLHVAAAVRIGVDEILTYDSRMAESAKLDGAQRPRPSVSRRQPSGSLRTTDESKQSRGEQVIQLAPP